MWARSWLYAYVSRRSRGAVVPRLGLVSVSSSEGLGLVLASAWIVNASISASVSGFKVSVSPQSRLKRPHAHPWSFYRGQWGLARQKLGGCIEVWAIFIHLALSYSGLPPRTDAIITQNIRLKVRNYADRSLFVRAGWAVAVQSKTESSPAERQDVDNVDQPRPTWPALLSADSRCL